MIRPILDVAKEMREIFGHYELTKKELKQDNRHRSNKTGRGETQRNRAYNQRFRHREGYNICRDYET